MPRSLTTPLIAGVWNPRFATMSGIGAAQRPDQLAVQEDRVCGEGQHHTQRFGAARQVRHGFGLDGVQQEDHGGDGNPDLLKHVLHTKYQAGTAGWPGLMGTAWVAGSNSRVLK